MITSRSNPAMLAEGTRRRDSLNVAVAAGVILYEIFHQMHKAASV